MTGHHHVAAESDVVPHVYTVTRVERERLNGYRSTVVWLTGLSGSGKSSIANELDRRLFEHGIRSYPLDGDAIRTSLSEDLGFSRESRRENVRRVARVAELMLDAGVVVIVALVSPFREDRDLAKSHFDNGDLLEVFVDTPLEICAERDPKGLYSRHVKQLSGVGQAYEPPLDPDVHLDGTQPIEDSVNILLSVLLARRVS